MKIKVCGMRNPKNISNLLVLKPDFVGFIFYKKSKRFVVDFPQIQFPIETKKVGVFVNERKRKIIKKVNQYKLDFVQLHGDETVEYCEKLIKMDTEKSRNSRTERSRSSCTERSRSENSMISIPLNYQLKIIKAFSVDEEFDFDLIKLYDNYCTYFLFDTKGKNYGGSGIKFNWKILQKYKGKTPYFLSGGIGLEDKSKLLSFLRRQESKLCIGIDINSGFEIEPALKNIEKIKEFKNNLV